ncbi:PrsW family intramembrane metalloprotease [Deinococcus sp. KSM4-11]|uniref:PrsW family intramembrane metalloprotease n=1 Tax=Deinococcus sp. KSM4-11 TaxID=2568654 RepID=UPI0010A45EC0|nr:PrsW family glutamic-type intramembrane protease [Deinococcus sp. KSM4-11]THF86429.1 PrsW family intramembrane metalloprotease [Deinococcus sp. KSM4-11]
MLLPLLVSFTLTFAWLWFFVRRDRHPEPAWLLARTFGWGMFAWLVAAALEASLGRLLNSTLPLALLLVALLTALVEEGSKFLAASTAISEASFDEPMDGLVYAVTAALGFALMENLTYSLGFGARAATWHAVVTTLAHALFSAPQGYALGGLHWQRGRSWVVQGVVLSVTLHFVFNSILGSAAGWPLLLALGLVVALMIVLAGRYYLTFEAFARQIGDPRQGSHPPPPEQQNPVDRPG